jgi:hypothetical protein
MPPTGNRRSPEELRKLARNFARIQHFTDKTTVLKFYQQSLKNEGFDRLGIRVYDLAEAVGQHLTKNVTDVTFGDFKKIDYSIFKDRWNIGPNTFAILNGLQIGIADNAKADKSDAAIDEGLAKLEALAGPVRAEELVKEIIAETPVPVTQPLVQEVPFVTPPADDAAYDRGFAEGQLAAYREILRHLGGVIIAYPDSAHVVVNLLSSVTDMKAKVAR